MNNFDIQKLRELPIEGVAQQLGMTVQKHKALCPFHADKHPSLSFKVSKNSFRCFSCGQYGGVIDLAMQVLGKDFKETCQWLADEHSLCHPEHSLCHPERSEGSENIHQELITEKYGKYFIRPFLNQAAQAFLFQERKLHPAVVRWCRLTSWTDRQGTPWLQIPYYDVDGKLIGVQNRRLSHCHQDSVSTQPRFKFPKGSKCNIYNLPILNLLKEGDELWISEGCSDCWALLSSGRKAIAIPSSTLLNPKDLEMLKNIRNHKSDIINPSLHMVPDNDAPGERLYQQLKQLFPQLVLHPLPEGYKDFSEWYMSSVQSTCHPERSEGSR